MARTFLTINGTGTIYTVPTGKVAKVIVQRIVDFSRDAYINIGQYRKDNTLDRTLRSDTRMGETIYEHDSSVLCVGDGVYDSYVIVIIREHILTEGESVYISSGTLYITVIEEDV